VAVADVSRLRTVDALPLAAGVALVLLLLLMVGCFALGYGSAHIGVTQRSSDRSAVRLDLERPEGRASIDRIGVLSGRLTMLEGEAAPLASRPVADLARHGDLGTGLSRLDNELARLEAMVARWPTSPSPTIPRAWLFPADGSSAGVASVSSPGITWPRGRRTSTLHMRDVEARNAERAYRGTAPPDRFPQRAAAPTARDAMSVSRSFQEVSSMFRRRPRTPVRSATSCHCLACRRSPQAITTLVADATMRGCGLPQRRAM
jgi:hypothetical protein